MIIRGRPLFHILFTGSYALNNLFYFPLNKKIIASKKLNMGFLSVSNFVPCLIFIVNTLGIVTDQFAGSGSSSVSSSRFTAMGIDGKLPIVVGSGVGVYNYSREVIILNTSVKGG